MCFCTKFYELRWWREHSSQHYTWPESHIAQPRNVLSIFFAFNEFFLDSVWCGLDRSLLTFTHNTNNLNCEGHRLWVLRVIIYRKKCDLQMLSIPQLTPQRSHDFEAYIAKSTFWLVISTYMNTCRITCNTLFVPEVPVAHGCAYYCAPVQQSLQLLILLVIINHIKHRYGHKLYTL